MLKIFAMLSKGFAAVVAAIFANPTKIGLSLLEDHKGIRRGLVIWSAYLITWVVERVFSDISKINGDVVAALTAVIGMLSTSIAFYHWSRQKDAQK